MGGRGAGSGLNGFGGGANIAGSKTAIRTVLGRMQALKPISASSFEKQASKFLPTLNPYMKKREAVRKFTAYFQNRGLNVYVQGEDSTGFYVVGHKNGSQSYYTLFASKKKGFYLKKENF